MTSASQSPLDLQRLRAAAKRLKKAFAAGDADAARRLYVHVPGAVAPKHADFLHVIAREEGHESWPKLKVAAETAAMNRAERAKRLEHGLRYGQRWVVEKLLHDEPDLPAESFALEIATYDANAVSSCLQRDPAAATRILGDRPPLLHLAFSKYIHMEPQKRDAMLAIAEALIASGASANDSFTEPGSHHAQSALYGALGHADNMALAAWLLERGASPDDGESLYHATELGHHDGLRLLMKHGVTARGTNALPRAMDFNDAEAVRLLLEYDASQRKATDGEGKQDSVRGLHQAARRWCSPEIAHLLLDHGADPNAIWNGHTPYATARIFGNQPFADALAGRGASTSLSPAEAILAHCAIGAAPAVRLDAHALSREDQVLLNRLIWLPVSLDHIKALVAAGLDPDKADSTGMTPLHYAAWEGLPERVAYLLSVGADINHRNGYGGDVLSATMHGAEFCPKAARRDHIACLRLLLEAGATVRPRAIEHCGNEDVAVFLEDWIGRQR